MSAPIDLLNLPAFATSTFSITYVPNGGTDHWGESCLTFPDEAKAAFDAAAAVWGSILQSPVPITIRACWANLGSSGILGYSGGAPLHKDFSNAPRANTWYEGSLANALAGSDLDPGSFDMNITYNLDFPWYFGTDGVTPSGQYDFMSVVLHEIAHGLNFSGSMQYSEGQGSWGYNGYPIIYDTLIRDGSGNLLIDTGVYGNPSAGLGSALTSNDIWFHGSNAMAANDGQRVKMYAPSTWAPGSSYAHLDYFTFAGTANRLMVYAISDGISTHDPGPVAKGLLQDLGWPIASGGLKIQPEVAAGNGHTVGLKSDGTVVAVGDNSSGQRNVGSWTHIVQVAAGYMHTVGLKADGTVVGVGNSTSGQLNLGSWSNIVQVAAGYMHTVGLKSDGTVVAVGYSSSGQLGVGSWNSIVKVASGWIHTLGLKSDGTVVAAGDNLYGQLNVGAWNLGPSIPGDFAPADCDVDGTDLAVLIVYPSLIDLTTFVENFGRNDCP
jgi:hypothetical protein